MLKRDNCVRCGAQSIGSNERVALTCQHWHHLAWDHSQDSCDANVAVERLKAEPFLGVKLPHIPIHHVRWATVQDASWANAAEDHSQGAFLVGATSPGLWNNLPSPFALLSHKSHCLKRKCSSTLAAETQIMSEALADVEWIRRLFEELTNPKISIVEWAARSRNRGLLHVRRTPKRDSQKFCQSEMPRACMIIYALRRRVVPTTGGRRSTLKSSGPAWTHKVHWYVGLITVVCMLTQ